MEYAEGKVSGAKSPKTPHRGRNRFRQKQRGIWCCFEYGKLVAVGDRFGEHKIPSLWLHRLETPHPKELC